MNETRKLKFRRWLLNLQVRWGWRKAGRLTRRAILSHSKARRARLFETADLVRYETYDLQDALMETYGIRGFIPPPKYLQGLSVQPRREEQHLKLLWVVE